MTFLRIEARTQNRENNPMQSKMGPGSQHSCCVAFGAREEKWSVVTAQPNLIPLARRTSSCLGRDTAQQKSRRSCDTPALLFTTGCNHTLTSGPREAGPLGPPLGPPDFGLRGVVRLRVPGSFSGFGVTGPSTYSKPILSLLVASSLTSTTRTWPPPLSWP